MDGISSVPGPPTWRRAHYHRGGVIIYHLLQHNNTQQAQQGGKTQKVESGGIQARASKVLPLGLKRGELGGSHRTLKQKSVLLPSQTCLRLKVQGFHWKLVMLALCLRDKPQLPKFQTPSRKAGVHHGYTVCTVNLGKLVQQGQSSGGQNSLISVGSIPKSSSKMAAKS